MKKPNIVFLFSDQQRWDTVGCYGQKLNITPNLDNLAEEGVQFEKSFTCQPVCGPARSCLQTGKYATETGCYRNDIALPQDEKTIAHWATEAGYKVAYVGKWHLASTGGESNEDIGEKIDYQTKAIPLEYRGGWKDYWVASDILEFTSHGYGGHMFDGEMKKRSFDGYRVDEVTNFVLEFLDSTKNDEEPFLLFTSYIEPHHQNDRNRYEGPKGSKEKFKNYEVPGDLKGTDGDWEKNYPDYLGCCHSIDENVGRIVDKLKSLGIIDDTIIIYTSDHGSHFRTRNDEYKRSCHDASIRTPLIINGVNFNQGKLIKEMVNLIDLPPTILEIMGLDVPNYMQGSTLQRLVNEENENWKKEVFIQISESQVGRAIRTQKWKYSVLAPEKDGIKDSSSDIYVEDCLYNLEEDPHEKNNLIESSGYEEIKEELMASLKRRMSEAGETIPKIISKS